MKESRPRRSRTADRGPPAAPGAHAVIHTTTQIGPKRRVLPNGSLLCEDVPLARTGWLIYGPGETPIRVGSTRDGAPLAYVFRSEEDLFSPETMGSFVGVAACDEHPAMDVTPKNWKSIARGSVIAVRRGVGDQADVLLGDILVTDQGLIDQITAGKREVSAGYEADYLQTGDGEGRQFNIIANHVALVRKGRCGPRCSIGDRAHQTEDERSSMAAKDTGGAPRKRARLEELRDTITEHLEELDEDQDGDGVHVHVHTQDGEPRGRTLDAAAEQRISGIEDGMLAISNTITAMSEAVTKLADQVAAAAATRAATGDSGEGGDSKALERSFQEMIAQAEVLVPGYRVPTFDAAAARKATVDGMCGTRRSVLNMAYATAEGKKLVDSVTGDIAYDEKMDCAGVAMVFRAAAVLKGAGNNRAATGDSARIPGKTTDDSGTPRRPTFAEINSANEKFWAERNGIPTPHAA